MVVGIACANARRGLDHRLWEVFAYAARYGKQPLSELKTMTVSDLMIFVAEVSKIVSEESKPRESA